jgi:hypothetical protein
MSNERRHRFPLNLPTDLFDKMSRLAGLHERSVTAEIIVAVRYYLRAMDWLDGAQPPLHLLAEPTQERQVTP